MLMYRWTREPKRRDGLGETRFGEDERRPRTENDQHTSPKALRRLSPLRPETAEASTLAYPANQERQPGPPRRPAGSETVLHVSDELVAVALLPGRHPLSRTHPINQQDQPHPLAYWPYMYQASRTA